MSQLQTEELAGYPASWFRNLITKEEYERQAVDYTKQQLQTAALYNQHTFHFFVLGVTQKLAVLWNRKVMYTTLGIGAVFLAFVLFGVFAGGDPRHTEGGSLVPALTFSQRVAAASFDVLDKIRQLTGQTQQSLLLPEDRSGFGYSAGVSNSSGNSTHAIPLGYRKDQHDYVVVVDANKPNEKPATGETALVDSPTGFSTFIQSQTYKGMNIFTFAFSVAKELAASIFATAFGWSNATAVSA